MSEPTKSDPTRETPTPTPAAELTDDQLDKVAGGLLPANQAQAKMHKPVTTPIRVGQDAADGSV